MRGQHLQQALVFEVELGVAQARQDDHADDELPDEHGHQEHRFDDVVGALDLDRELDLLSVRREQRGAVFGDPARHPFTDLGDELLQGLLLVLVEDLATERDREQGVTVGLQQVHAAVVVVDDRAQLVGDGGAHLFHAAHGVQGGGQAVQHVELGHRAEALGRSWCRHHVHPLTGCC